MTEKCPKCGHLAGATSSSCPRCGLLRSRWSGYEERIPPHPILDPLWSALLNDWTDEKRHHALASAVATDWPGLSALMQRYRQVLRDRTDDTMAKSAMARLTQLAMQLPMSSMGPPGPPMSPRLVRGTLGACLLVGAIWVLIAIYCGIH